MMKHLIVILILLAGSTQALDAQPRVNSPQQTPEETFSSSPRISRIPRWQMLNGIWKKSKYTNLQTFHVDSAGLYVISKHWRSHSFVATGRYSIDDNKTISKERRSVIDRSFRGCILSSEQYDSLKNIRMGDSLVIKSNLIWTIDTKREKNFLKYLLGMRRSRTSKFYMKVFRTTDGKREVIRFSYDKSADFQKDYWELPYSKYKRLFTLKYPLNTL